MSEDQRKTAQNIMKMLENLPEAKREYIVGFGEGMAAAREEKEKEEKEGDE